MAELFVCGDPRFLSGGKGARATNYGNVPRGVESLSGSVFCTGTIPALESATVESRAASSGQTVHSGKTGYHHTPSYNSFLHDGEWPSAGIELETHLRQFDAEFAGAAESDLHSNWFHFERDGSLDRAHSGAYGYELITEPLPPRAYRDQRLWTGLQNLCAPWLQSFGCEETGLHVHVGLNQFEGFDAIPLPYKTDRRSIGKMLSAVVYYCVADQAFIDRVALRKPTGYCGQAEEYGFVGAAGEVAAGRATGAWLVDYCVSTLMRRRGRYVSDVEAAYRAVQAEVRCEPVWIDNTVFACGHGTEINQEHSYTVEFRRAKGTLHALSVHRIVELMTSIVRFAGKICREPDFTVTRDSFMDWLIQTTTSEALRNLAKQTKG